MTAKNGAKMESMLRNVEKIASRILMMGFAIPAVTVVLVARAELVVVAILAAVPPPAIIARVQL